jgi:hypothetical protein
MPKQRLLTVAPLSEVGEMAAAHPEFGVGSRVRLGVLLGASLGMLFSMFVALVWLTNDRSLGRLEISLFEAIALYMIRGVVMGGFVGLLYPLTRNPTIAAIVGGAVMAALMVPIAFLSGAAANVSILAIGASAVAGAVAGVITFGKAWREGLGALDE